MTADKMCWLFKLLLY
uniref:Uncharacterized protein n=1 Tax=Arundo donax TaxID=35708 RepID=A0A0A9G925_ARUDO